MDSICLQAAADSVYRLTKRIASRMGFDKDPDKVETVASKKEKEKQVKGLSRNFAKVSHSNPIIVAEYLVSYVSHMLICFPLYDEHLCQRRMFSMSGQFGCMLLTETWKPTFAMPHPSKLLHQHVLHRLLAVS